VYESAQIRVHLEDVDLHLADQDKLANLLAEVVKVESPVHWEEAARRVLGAAGVQRFGSRIRETFKEAVRMGISRKLFTRRGDFLWSLDIQQPIVRDRSVLLAASRKLDHASWMEYTSFPVAVTVVLANPICQKISRVS
jgi:hypothetical protein